MVLFGAFVRLRQQQNQEKGSSSDTRGYKGMIDTEIHAFSVPLKKNRRVELCNKQGQSSLL